MSRKTSLEIIHVTLMTPMTTVAKRFSAEKTILKISILDFLLWVFMCVQSNHPEDDKNELPPDLTSGGKHDRCTCRTAPFLPIRIPQKPTESNAFRCLTICVLTSIIEIRKGAVRANG